MTLKGSRISKSNMEIYNYISEKHSESGHCNKHNLARKCQENLPKGSDI